MTTELRWAQPKDVEDLALILHEMAAHYDQAPLGDETTAATVRRWLQNESPAYPHFALAYKDGEISGLASVAIAHPGADLERLLFLKDLFVREKFRSAGLGVSLLRFLAAECLARGIGRIDLTTEDWNEGALRFYGRLGAARHDQKVFLRFDTGALNRLARQADNPI
jgi:GNAT superfamily N-acetyltransferase